MIGDDLPANRCWLGLALVAALILVSSFAHAQTEKVLYSFSAVNGLAPYPYTGVIRAGGNLYGTTYSGGAYGKGSIYKLNAKGVATTLYSFTGGADGRNPYGALLRDSNGNLYGTTTYGGANDFGTVYELTSTGIQTVLHSFANDGVDGALPWSTLIRDKQGNLYGTTVYGGPYRGGTIFKLTPTGTESILYSFGAYSGDGLYPNAQLVRDGKGNLYGTTYNGGAHSLGTVFKLDMNGAETILHDFVKDGVDGYQPFAGVIRDSSGNLYGTTINGGQFGDGTVFRITPQGVETILLAFQGWDGGHPYAPLVRDAAGNLYGTAGGGGLNGQNGFGTVFRIAANGVETVLYTFTGQEDGGWPYAAALVRDGKGNLYGTTTYGGASLNGTVYKVTP